MLALSLPNSDSSVWGNCSPFNFCQSVTYVVPVVIVYSNNKPLVNRFWIIQKKGCTTRVCAESCSSQYASMPRPFPIFNVTISHICHFNHNRSFCDQSTKIKWLVVSTLPNAFETEHAFDISCSLLFILFARSVSWSKKRAPFRGSFRNFMHYISFAICLDAFFKRRIMMRKLIGQFISNRTYWLISQHGCRSGPTGEGIGLRNQPYAMANPFIPRRPVQYRYRDRANNPVMGQPVELLECDNRAPRCGTENPVDLERCLGAALVQTRLQCAHSLASGTLPQDDILRNDCSHRRLPLLVDREMHGSRNHSESFRGYGKAAIRADRKSVV